MGQFANPRREKAPDRIVWLDDESFISPARFDYAVERRRSEIEREVAIDAAVIEHMRVTQ